jgi:predicted nuclease with RNAse H fold
MKMHPTVHRGKELSVIRTWLSVSFNNVSMSINHHVALTTGLYMIIYIVESGVKHHKPNHNPKLFSYSVCLNCFFFYKGLTIMLVVKCLMLTSYEST